MIYEKFMKKCIQLAKLGEGKTSPNPLVGCVVLDKFGNVISCGYHKAYGENHAERDALLKLKKGEEKDGILIVNLEPCSHFGKTPPCTDLIIERRIKKVVIGIRDVNPIVSGNGIKKLKDAGIEVIEGVLEKECTLLNEIFIKNMKEKKIFVAIKTATTLDGKIATKNGSSKWITSSLAREEVKVIRNRYDAIMTSSSTIIADNPTMEHNTKIVLDRELKTDLDSKIYSKGEIIVFNSKKDDIVKKIKYIKTPVVNNKLDLEFILEKLFEIGIRSVLVESGGILNGEILKYTDKIYQFIAPKITGDNSSKSCFDFRKIDDINECSSFKITDVKHFSPDILITLKKIVE